MITSIKIKNAALILCAFALPLLTTSCGKDVAPDPARSENKLVFELFNSLKTGDTKATLKKVERLRILNPDSIFLANLEKTIYINLVVSEVETLLNEEKLVEAIDRVSEASSLYPGLDEFNILKKDLVKLHEVEKHINQSIAAKGATELRKSIASLQRIAARQPNKLLQDFITAKQLLATKMAILENKRLSLFDLTLDIDYGYNRQSDSCWNDLAQMALEEPNSPVVKHYMGIMQGTVEPGSFILPKK